MIASSSSALHHWLLAGWSDVLSALAFACENINIKSTSNDSTYSISQSLSQSQSTRSFRCIFEFRIAIWSTHYEFDTQMIYELLFTLTRQHFRCRQQYRLIYLSHQASNSAQKMNDYSSIECFSALWSVRQQFVISNVRIFRSLNEKSRIRICMHLSQMMIKWIDQSIFLFYFFSFSVFISFAILSFVIFCIIFVCFSSWL